MPAIGWERDAARLPHAAGAERGWPGARSGLAVDVRGHGAADPLPSRRHRQAALRHLPVRDGRQRVVHRSRPKQRHRQEYQPAVPRKPLHRARGWLEPTPVPREWPWPSAPNLLPTLPPRPAGREARPPAFPAVHPAKHSQHIGNPPEPSPPLGQRLGRMGWRERRWPQRGLERPGCDLSAKHPRRPQRAAGRIPNSPQPSRPAHSAGPFPPPRQGRWPATELPSQRCRGGGAVALAEPPVLPEPDAGAKLVAQTLAANCAAGVRGWPGAVGRRSSAGERPGPWQPPAPWRRAAAWLWAWQRCPPGWRWPRAAPRGDGATLPSRPSVGRANSGAALRYGLGAARCGLRAVGIGLPSAPPLAAPNVRQLAPAAEPPTDCWLRQARVRWPAELSIPRHRLASEPVPRARVLVPLPVRAQPTPPTPNQRPTWGYRLRRQTAPEARLGAGRSPPQEEA